ncbi:alpha/beta hydrolase [Enterococcus sp. 669A]|uniref:Alpha/beta hydrolase n=1 Tax=Candidatus Enterococcus moelleringii TaxID=2815325 RepID=A0ABS3LBN9_9ENTE|nr:alpha/beta hydrolase [Enterococcus sp. 669A]
MKKSMKILIGILVVIIIALIFAGNYFYNYAVVPAEKDFLGDGSYEKSAELIQAEAWFTDDNNRTTWELKSEDGLDLSAIYLPADSDQKKTAIIAHGYMGKAEDMAQYAELYHSLGYNVLLPDARGHGSSEGDYIGFGWDERKDYQQWIQEVLDKTNADESIVLHGVSMGAATVMMTSGEELPDNVKAIVEDCGYTSAKDELSYQLKQMFNLPQFPLIQVTSLITKIRAGYFFGEADAVKQLQKNTTPMLFIHGDKDDFVPFFMLDEVYDATDAPKEKYVVPDAGHAQAMSKDPAKYKETVANFLAAHP